MKFHVRRDEFSRFVELVETCHVRGIKEFQLVVWNSVASFEEENTRLDVYRWTVQEDETRTSKFHCTPLV